MRIGFVGLGQMGAPMARRLASWPGGLLVYDVDAPAAARFDPVAGSLEELAEACELVCVMVRDDAQVSAVVETAAGRATQGTVIAVHSTVEPDTPVRLAALCASVGIEFLDAPVSGGVGGAASGRLALLVGGAEDAVERCREPLSCFADLIVRFGAAGAGTRAKLARNLANFVGFAAALEACRLAGAAGVDVAGLSRVTLHSDAVTGGPGAIMVRGASGPLAADDPLRAVFAHTAELGEKDLDLAMRLGSSLGLELPLAAAGRAHLAAYLGLA